MDIPIPGKGKQRYRKHFESGVACIKPVALGIKAKDVQSETFIMSCDYPIPPYVRPKLAAWIAQVCRAELYNRLREGRYRSVRDGRRRLVETASIYEDQARLADKTPEGGGGLARGPKGKILKAPQRARLEANRQP